MVQFSNLIIVYFVVGAVMFGGGAVTFDDSGVTKFFVDMDGNDVSPDGEPESKLSGLSGTITSLVGQFGAPLVLIWNLVVGVVSFLHWPLTVLIENNAPPRVTLLLGGTFTAMFYMALLGLVTRSS